MDVEDPILIRYRDFMFLRAAAVTLLLILNASYIPFVKADEEMKVFFYLHDHLGGIEKVLNEELEVIADRDYLPFGSDLIDARAKFPELYGDADSSDFESENYGYTGKELDVETELYYYGARYFDPVTVRFISFDPVLLDEAIRTKLTIRDILSQPQLVNSYSYSSNNPLIYTDPSGEFPQAVGLMAKSLVKKIFFKIPAAVTASMSIVDQDGDHDYTNNPENLPPSGEVVMKPAVKGAIKKRIPTFQGKIAVDLVDATINHVLDFEVEHDGEFLRSYGGQVDIGLEGVDTGLYWQIKTDEMEDDNSLNDSIDDN